MITASLNTLIITMLLLLCGGIIARTYRLTRAIRFQHNIANYTANDNSPIGHFGCSVICTDVTDIDHVARLLTCDYCHHEVILTLNSATKSELFRSILKHYKLINVNSSTSQEIHTVPITALYRSRQRGYRRLIVVDTAAKNQYEALNAALNICCYDYIIPLTTPIYLRHNALSIIATTLALESPLQPEMIFCDTATPCHIFHRDTLIERGGFSSDIIKRYPATATHHIYLNLMQRFETPNKEHVGKRACTTITLVATILIFAALLPCRIIICILSTFALAMTSSYYIIKLEEVENCSVKTMLYQFSNLITFFRSRKFPIS